MRNLGTVESLRGAINTVDTRYVKFLGADDLINTNILADLCANSPVSKNTNEGTLVAGSPAKEICLASKMRLQDGSRKPAYPWRSHFHRGYPVDVVSDWKEEFEI